MAGAEPISGQEGPKSLGAMLEGVVAAHPAAVAYRSYGVSFTYREFLDQVTSLSSFLANVWRLKKGDRLAMLMPNLIQSPITTFAALRLGVVLVNLNPLYTEREIVEQLQGSGATHVVALSTLAPRLLRVCREVKLSALLLSTPGEMLGARGMMIDALAALKAFRGHVGRFPCPIISMCDALQAGAAYEPPRAEVGPSDLALLQYTGGTTGKPKGAMLSHGNLLANIAQVRAYLGTELREANEVALCALPLYHIFSQTVCHLTFISAGATVALVADPRRPGPLARAIAAEGVTYLFGVDPLFRALAHEGPLQKGGSASALRHCIAGGTALRQDTASLFLEQTGHPVIEGYGLTECSPVCAVAPLDGSLAGGSIGFPLPGLEITLIDEKGERVTSPGVPGELWVRGPNVMQGYYQNPGETAHALHEGMVRSGDIAVWRENGSLCIIDRLKDMINVSGFNVFPSEVEATVLSHPKIAECAAVAMPDERSGERICLFAVRHGRLSEEELLAFCRESLTGYKVPSKVVFMKSLPRSAVGKVLRPRLRELAQGKA
ncbi:MAG: AMP-binding protein [Succinivibrionaceae bacterium]|nr:AMP-binding protein [Succinivibrionaceae bacterium]